MRTSRPLLALSTLCLSLPIHAATTLTISAPSLAGFTTGPFEELNTIAANVGLADEVATGPAASGQTNLNTNVLTWQAANTGFSTGFRLTALQSGANLVFDDDEGSNIANFDNAISIGDIDNQDTDSFTLEFLSGGYQSIGFEIRDSNNWSNEILEVFDIDGLLQATFDIGAFDASANLDNDNQFLGLRASDYIIGSIRYTEASESGNNEAIAIANFAFADFGTGLPDAAVPAPAAAFLLGLGGLAVLRRRQRA